MNRYVPPEADRVLVVAPHPDDEVLGCGGTIARYARQNVQVRVVIVSDGAKIAQEFPGANHNFAEIRKNEALNALPLLGVHEIDFLGFPDGELAVWKNEILHKIEDILREYKPDIVFSPSPIDYHADHIAVSEILLALFNRKAGFQIAFYEVYETIRFNTLVDISDTMDLKKSAIYRYQYSLFQCPEVFWDAVKGLNSFRSLYTRESRYYEAFWLVSEPLQKSQLIQWLTCGLEGEDPAVLLLEKIKAVDELLFQLKQSHELLELQESEIQKLKVVIEKNENDLENIRSELDEIVHSHFWTLARQYYRLRDNLLPEGSWLRHFYDKVMASLKSK
jgi:LmbE family N-acetylglucosaminyl deacetylase